MEIGGDALQIAQLTFFGHLYSRKLLQLTGQKFNPEKRNAMTLNEGVIADQRTNVSSNLY